MIVVKNTYPVWPKVAHAEAGDVVSWQASKKGWELVRESDGKTVFSRDKLPKDQEDLRPMVGVIAQVMSRGWLLELEG